MMRTERTYQNRPPRVLLSPSVCDDPDVASRLQHAATELMDFATLEEFAEPYQDLLERQLNEMERHDAETLIRTRHERFRRQGGVQAI